MPYSPPPPAPTPESSADTLAFIQLDNTALSVVIYVENSTSATQDARGQHLGAASLGQSASWAALAGTGLVFDI